MQLSQLFHVLQETQGKKWNGVGPGRPKPVREVIRRRCSVQKDTALLRKRAASVPSMGLRIGCNRPQPGRARQNRDPTALPAPVDETDHVPSVRRQIRAMLIDPGPHPLPHLEGVGAPVPSDRGHQVRGTAPQDDRGVILARGQNVYPRGRHAQSPSACCHTVIAATAAVSARRMRGPKLTA